MKMYLFPVVIEPDEYKWSAYVPGLIEKGAATLGNTREEALQNIQEITQMVMESLLEHGESLPAKVTESDQPVISANHQGSQTGQIFA